MVTMESTATIMRPRRNPARNRTSRPIAPKALMNGSHMPHRVVPPSQCDRCVPTVRIVEDAMFVVISESAHEPSCPNHPANTGLIVTGSNRRIQP